jgi:predicted MFS family arabinose efflux permease
LVLALTHSAAKAGIVGFAATVPWFLFSLPAGAVVDRLNRKRVMLSCEGLRALALGSIAFSLAIGHLHYAQVAVVAFVETTLTILFFVSERATLRQVVSQEQLSDAVAQNQARSFAGSLVGPPLGGFLFGVGRAIPFLVDAVSYAASFAGIAALRGNLRGEPAARTHFHREIVDGLRWLWRQKFLRSCSMLAAGMNPFWEGIIFFIVVASRLHGASPHEIGIMMAIVGGGGLIGALLAPRLQRRISTRIVVLGQPWVAALLTPLAAVTTNPYLLGSIVAVMLLVLPTWESVVVGYRLSLVPDHLQGRVQSVGVFISHTGDALGPLATGLLISAFGSRPAALALAAWALLVAIAATSSQSLRDAPSLVAPAGV